VADAGRPGARQLSLAEDLVSTAVPPYAGDAGRASPVFAPPAPALAPTASRPSLAAPPDPAHRVGAVRRAAPLVLGMTFGVLVGWFGAEAADRLVPRLFHMQGPLAWAEPVVLLAVLFAVILVHELGHLAAGALNGARAMLLVVGPLHGSREGGGWRWRLNRSAGLAGGLAVSVPDVSDAASPDRTRRVMRRIVFGGPLASVLLAAAAALGAWALDRSGASGNGAALLLSALIMAALVSGGIGVLTLLPMRTGGFASDGRRALDLRAGAPGAPAEAAQLAIVALATGGRRARDWPSALVEQAAALPPGAPAVAAVTAHSLASAHHFDRGDVERGRAHLVRALAAREAYPKPARPALLDDAAWVAAWHDRDLAAARALADESAALGRGFDLTPFLRHRARAAVAWLAGDGPAARAALAEARRDLERVSVLALYAVPTVREHLDALEAELDGRRGDDPRNVRAGLDPA
jgi:hypothetical protein